MAKSWTTNQSPATSAAAIFTLKALLKSVGWLVKSSSDGTTYNSSADQITTGSSGAGGMANSRAWFRIQDPGGGREFCFQRGSGGNAAWWIRYSRAAKFTGGSPDATNMPTATDGVDVFGFTTAGTTAFNGTEGSMRYSCMADSSAPYGFWSYAFSNGGSTNRHLLIFDGLQSGSYHASDTDPVVVGLFGTGTTDLWNSPSAQLTIMRDNGGGGFPGFAGLINGTWVSLGVLMKCVDNGSAYYAAVPGGLPVSPYSGNDEVFAPELAKTTLRAGVQGWKGVMSNFRMIGPQRALSGDTLTVVSTRDYIVVEKVWALPWDGSVVTV